MDLSLNLIQRMQTIRTMRETELKGVLVGESVENCLIQPCPAIVSEIKEGMIWKLIPLQRS